MKFSKFKHYIEVYQAQEKREQKFGTALEDFINGVYVPCFADKLMTEYFNLLDEYFNSGDTISWWYYEWDKGVREAEGTYGMYHHEIPVPMKNLEDLYTYLMWCKTRTDEDEWDGTFKVSFE